jgi:sugar lactone lactonase YvrE
MNAPGIAALPVLSAALGECPVWDERLGALLWVDQRAPALFRWFLDGGGMQRFELPAAIGCFALDRAGGAVLALASGFATLDFSTGAVTPIATDAPLLDAEHRFNDGAADPAGNFWAGTLHHSYRRPSGALWRLSPDGRAERMLDGLTVPNGLAWSPDGGRFYFNDSPRGMFACDVRADGTLGAPAPFGAAAPGHPDGTAVDAEGYLWNARWDGGGVARFAPDGRLDRFVPLPVARPTSCAIGGPGFDTLFVTTARLGLEPDALARQRLAGAILALQPGVRGRAARRRSLTTFPVD